MGEKYRPKAVVLNSDYTIYKAKNVDTDKALEALNYALKIQREIVEVEIKEKRAYLQGIEKGIGIAESIFQCSNYEKTEKGGASE